MNPESESSGTESATIKPSHDKRAKWGNAVVVGAVVVLVALTAFDWYRSRNQQSRRGTTAEAKPETVYRSGELTFHASSCSDGNDIALADKLRTEGHTLPQISWRSDGTFTADFSVGENCAVTFPSARFIRQSRALQLEYVQRDPVVPAACLCVFELKYEIVGLEKADFQILVAKVIAPADPNAASANSRLQRTPNSERR